METKNKFKQICIEIKEIYKSLWLDGKIEERNKFAKEIARIITDELPNGITDLVE